MSRVFALLSVAGLVVVAVLWARSEERHKQELEDTKALARLNGRIEGAMEAVEAINEACDAMLKNMEREAAIDAARSERSRLGIAAFGWHSDNPDGVKIQFGEKYVQYERFCSEVSEVFEKTFLPDAPSPTNVDEAIDCYFDLCDIARQAIKRTVEIALFANELDFQVKPEYPQVLSGLMY